MLKAKLDSVRKNKKGFSLVELIIVIAIMVALIAVMAPAFVKYVQKSRDAAFTTACEDYFTALKTYYGDPDTEIADLQSGEIKMSINAEKHFDINTTISCKDDIKNLAGVDTAKKMGATEKTCTIKITKDSSTGGFSFEMTYSPAA